MSRWEARHRKPVPTTRADQVAALVEKWTTELGDFFIATDDKMYKRDSFDMLHDLQRRIWRAVVAGEEHEKWKESERRRGD